MLGSHDVMAFVATTRADQARAFYRDVLGLKLVSDEDYAIVFDANGIMLRIQKVRELSPPPHTMFGWKVTGIEAVIAGLRERGVTMERYSFMEQDAHDIWHVPDGTKVAWFKDPDGNLLSLTEFAT